MSDEVPEPDRLDGALHPRETQNVFGHDAAEADFLQAVNSNKLHHAWLITGPKGIGKASLAWRFARFLLTTPVVETGGMFDEPLPSVDTLDVSAEHPVARRLLAGSEPRIFLLRRPWDDKSKKLKSEITVDEARKLKSFFALSAADGGRRVVIVDSADELNPNAANAVLKILEEPPENTVMMLISHQPSRLLPTIRSRCRTLRCHPLGPEDLTRALEPLDLELPSDPGPLDALAAGSVGASVQLLIQDGMQTYGRLVQLMSGLPKVDRSMAIAFADWAAVRSETQRLELVLSLTDLFLSRLARTGVAGAPQIVAAQGEAELMVRLCPNAEAARKWAELHQTLGARTRHGVAVNLDPAALILDMVLKINSTAGTVSSR
jgi:DNA polymerase-3 subunit delta'